MYQRSFLRILLLALGTLVWLGSTSDPVRALPSYARQTGFSCAQCHTIYPELTPLGRRFKLTGYLLTTTPSQGTPQEEYVLNRTPPISAMLMLSATQTQRDLPDSGVASGNTAPGAKAQNDSVSFPQQLSLFYAGRISPNTGAFMQITYSGQADHFSMDNTDIRMVDQGAIGSAQFVYGLTLNNNPTIQDLWNSTPAFGYRYASTAATPTLAPGAAIQLDGSLAQKVAGLGAYAAWLRGTSFLYAEFSAYQSFQPGAPQPLDSSTATSPVVRDTAPYLRVAYEVNWATTSLEVGALGMNATLLPLGVPANNGNPGPCAGGTSQCKGLNQVAPNRYSDSGLDGQVQYIPSDETILTANAIWLHEDQSLGADSGAAHGANSLDTMRVTGSYYHNRTEGIVAQWFSTTGSKDTGIYGANRTNAPDTSGYVVELVYNPYLNVRYSLQYTLYDKFNGAATNYDTFGRNASDNNTLYLLAWLMF
jgi:hypothetical protein